MQEGMTTRETQTDFGAWQYCCCLNSVGGAIASRWAFSQKPNPQLLEDVNTFYRTDMKEVDFIGLLRSLKQGSWQLLLTPAMFNAMKQEYNDFSKDKDNFFGDTEFTKLAEHYGVPIKVMNKEDKTTTHYSAIGEFTQVAKSIIADCQSDKGNLTQKKFKEVFNNKIKSLDLVFDQEKVNSSLDKFYADVQSLPLEAPTLKRGANSVKSIEGELTTYLEMLMKGPKILEDYSLSSSEDRNEEIFNNFINFIEDMDSPPLLKTNRSEVSVSGSGAHFTSFLSKDEAAGLQKGKNSLKRGKPTKTQPTKTQPTAKENTQYLIETVKSMKDKNLQAIQDIIKQNNPSRENEKQKPVRSRRQSMPMLVKNQPDSKRRLSLSSLWLEDREYREAKISTVPSHSDQKNNFSSTAKITENPKEVNPKEVKKNPSPPNKKEVRSLFEFKKIKGISYVNREGTTKFTLKMDKTKHGLIARGARQFFHTNPNTQILLTNVGDPLSVCQEILKIQQDGDKIGPIVFHQDTHLSQEAKTILNKINSNYEQSLNHHPESSKHFSFKP
ncbi:MAG TPA: hypothetical protein QF353_03955 [Gammaproteobacteria bacterium]|nr:hypothetical protein [Gammaproteobacteria bacterium]